MSEKAKTAKEVLVAAKWILENVGWCQNVSVRIDSANRPVAYCLAGSMGTVETVWDERGQIGKSPWWKARTIVAETIQHLYKTHDMIPEWNDRQSRTKEEVLALLDVAIVKAS